jgi:hypothetical protein
MLKHSSSQMPDAKCLMPNATVPGDIFEFDIWRSAFGIDTRRFAARSRGFGFRSFGFAIRQRRGHW